MTVDITTEPKLSDVIDVLECALDTVKKCLLPTPCPMCIDTLETTLREVVTTLTQWLEGA